MPYVSYILILLLPFLLYSETFTAEVIRVIDGDSVNALRLPENKEVKLRLYGIDAPEWKQAYGKESKDALKGLLGPNIEISVKVLDKDRYGRLICEIHLNREDISLNEWMVSEGFAWHYVKYAPDDMNLKQAEDNARNNKLGLWSAIDPTPPWEYRKNQKAKKNDSKFIDTLFRYLKSISEKL
jgi:endonuclease YncB( thermonuclease family)